MPIFDKGGTRVAKMHGLPAVLRVLTDGLKCGDGGQTAAECALARPSHILAVGRRNHG
jgi:hypothetical protein